MTRPDLTFQAIKGYAKEELLTPLKRSAKKLQGKIHDRFTTDQQKEEINKKLAKYKAMPDEYYDWREDDYSMLGTNISVHPMQATLVSVCTSEGVKIWDMRNTTSHVELIRQGITSQAHTVHTACGATWSPTGQYMIVAKRITEELSKFSLTYCKITTARGKLDYLDFETN